VANGSTRALIRAVSVTARPTRPLSTRGPVDLVDRAELVTGLFAHVPDLRFDARRAYFGADYMVIEYGMSGTADGKAFVCDGVDVISLRDGLVARKDTYLDLAAFERQAGALPGSSSINNA
jgi:ketosteroid isomerase-like protein